MVLVGLSLLGCPHRPAPPPPTADVVITTDAVAVTVRDGLIQAIVPASQAGDFVGTDTQRLTGDTLTAGMVDAHAHPAGLASKRARLDLTGLTTYQATLDAVAAWPAGDWVVGRGWDQNDWSDPPEGGWPRAVDLDARLPGQKVALYRVDGHAAWVSPAVLDAAGITADTPDPEGGRLLRDADGKPTGVLIDTAMGLVQVPGTDPSTRRSQVIDALDYIASTGLTGVHAMGVSDGSLAIYTELAEAGTLPIHLWVYLGAESQAAQRLLRDGPWSSGRLRVVGIKAFADGALGSRGALLRQPYSDEPGHTGLSITSTESLTDLATRCLDARASLAVHAIGDLAVKNTLDAFQAARAAVPEAAEVPLRVEHAQVVHPDDVPRFAEIGAIASMQPTHATSDMPWAPDRLGPDRVSWSYAWRTLQRSGATLAFGSDFPVEAVDPALGLWAATTRQTLDGQPPDGWRPDEAMTREEALRHFTRGAALAVNEPERGRMDVGQPADLTLWRVTPTATGERYEALATLVDGQVVFRSPAADTSAATP